MSDSVKGTSEIEEFTNLYLIHPVSSGLVPRLAAWKITPNMVSLTGMTFGILAGFAYYHYQDFYMSLAGFFGMIMWHIMDGADGQLARFTRKYSEAGKILDGICDYVTFISVYTGIGLALSQQTGGQVWIIILSAGLLHAVQSGAYELQRGEYDYWGHGKSSAALPDVKQMVSELEGKSRLSLLMSHSYIGYVRMQRRSSGIDQDFRRNLAAALDNNPGKTAEIRALYRGIFAPAVSRWSLLCANYRTIAIFVACSAGQPVYFFWLEIAVLTPLLVLLVQKQRRLNRLFSLRLKEVI